MYTPTVRTVLVRRKRHTLRTVLLSVASTIVVMFIGLAVIGTVFPAPGPAIVKSVTVKTATVKTATH